MDLASPAVSGTSVYANGLMPSTEPSWLISLKNLVCFLVDFVCCGMKSKHWYICRLRLKCDGTRAETRFRLSAKRTNRFKSVGASVQSTTGSRGVHISGSNTGYTMFRGSVKSTGYQLYSPVFPSPPLPCVTVCHHISTGLYQDFSFRRYFRRVRMERLGSHRTDFYEIWHLNIFRKSVEKIQVSLKSEKNNECFTCLPIHIFIISRSVLLRLRSDSDKSCRENQNTHFVFSNIFPKIVPCMR